jgi:hypothetical protein
MQARRETQKAPTTAHVGHAVLLVNGGPPPSLRSALHLGLHRLGETTGRARRCRTLQSATLVTFAAGFRRRLEGGPSHIRELDTSTQPSRSDAEQGNNRGTLLVSSPAARLTRFSRLRRSRRSPHCSGERRARRVDHVNPCPRLDPRSGQPPRPQSVGLRGAGAGPTRLSGDVGSA